MQKERSCPAPNEVRQLLSLLWSLMEKYHEVLTDTYNLIVKLHSAFVDKWTAYLFPEEEKKSA